VVLVIAAASGLGPLFPVVRSLVALPFALAAVTVVFTEPGAPLGTVTLGSWHATATAPGLTRFASILLRSWLSVQMALLLTATTRFPDLIHALHHLRLPAVLVATISFMGRYLALIADEAGRLMRARDARSAAPDRRGGSLAWRAGVAGNMAGQLFLRSYDRSDRVYNAMLARGYAGNLLTMTPHRMRHHDWLAAAAFGSALAVVHAVAAMAR
jgi:cobalt/nickel transport system permease protein